MKNEPQKTLSELIYCYLFPDGIPYKVKDTVGAIDARIKEIEDLAEGKAVEGVNKRFRQRESQRINETIIRLRESTDPPMTYREICQRMGNCITQDAARNRYDDYKARLKKATNAHENNLYGESDERAIVRDMNLFSPGAEMREVVAGILAPATDAETGEQSPQVGSILLSKPEQIEEKDLAKVDIDFGREFISAKKILDNCIAPKKEPEEVTEAPAPAAEHPPAPDVLPARDLTRRNTHGRFKVPLSPETVAEIMRLRAQGMGSVQIRDELKKKGILITWERVRGAIAHQAAEEKRAARQEFQPTQTEPLEEHSYYQSQKKDDIQNEPLLFDSTVYPAAPATKMLTTDPSLPGVEGAQEEARANPRGAPDAEQPEPKSISRAELNIKIWDAWKKGDDPAKISEDLWKEGYFYDERQVRNRLRQQGADV